jgi:polyhydroxybutyrate depolymerase
VQRNTRRPHARRVRRALPFAWAVGLVLASCSPEKIASPGQLDEEMENAPFAPGMKAKIDAAVPVRGAADASLSSTEADAAALTGADAAPSGPEAEADAQSSSGDADPARTDGGANTASRPSAGCGRGGAPRTGTRSVNIAGKNRQFVLRVPEGYTGARALPVLFFLHGCNQNGPTAETTHARGFRNALGPHAALLYPSADGNCWRRDAADLAFFDELVKTVKTELCVDERRIFVTGISSGGYFSNDVGCQRGDVLRGLIPVAPGPGNWNNCKGPVDTMIIHAPRDSVVPFSRGLQVRDHWKGANGCTDRTGAGSDPICESYVGCKAGYPLQLCRHTDSFYQNTFHCWPLIANRLILEFIQRRP